MRKQKHECVVRWSLGMLWPLSWLFAQTLNLSAAGIDFSHQVVPILREHCAGCHTGEKQKGGLSMNTREALLKGGEDGEVVLPGRSTQSRLVARLLTKDPDDRMPPQGSPLPPEKVAVLQQWIDEGLPWTAGFAFRQSAYEPPLKPRRPVLPPAREGRHHPVDRILDAYLASHALDHPRPVSDGAFLRRASLDLLGLLPEPAALEKFMADPAPDKRSRLVHQLLANDPAYAEHWLSFWNDLLRNDYSGTGYIDDGRKQITAWLYRALIENKPYDQMVRELVAPSPESEGFVRGIKWRGEVSAGQSVPVQFAQSLGQAFLGINLKCASCHDSFIDHWKLADSYGLAAVYADKPLELYRCDKPVGQVARPAWLFPELGQVDPDKPPAERLRQLAALVTHPGNGRFARTIVNRLWLRLMGRGIVHPADAMQTEPWNADLLDFLANSLADNHYDLRKLLELICTSEAYRSKVQLVERGIDDHGYVYAGPRARRLTAEQFVDAVWQMTETAPDRCDAQVTRGRVEPSAVAAVRLSGQWLWSSDGAGSNLPPAGAAITLRKRFELPQVPLRAGAAITCDNSYALYINGRHVRSDDHWEDVEAVALASYLRKGTNEILVVARNAGTTPNPAGLFFEARLDLGEGKKLTVAGDTSWEWTKELPDNQGHFQYMPTNWQAAVPAADPSVWTQQVGQRLATALVEALLVPPGMARASLMKNDLLMRTLGRPSREQIVSSRPNDLTTLEAMDLSNGPILAARLEQGSQKLASRPWASNDAFTRWLYVFALARDPAPEELTVARETLGDRLAPQGVQDLLWSVCMLPEFQFIR